MWDLTTALEFFNKGEPTMYTDGGPTSQELVRLLDHCDLSNSRVSTPCCISPSPSLMQQPSVRFSKSSAGGGAAAALLNSAEEQGVETESET